MIGVLVRDDEFLAVRRAAQVPRGGHWCFPGGHVERGETSRAAIRREMFEELGIEVEPTCRLGAIRLRDAGYLLVAWTLRLVAGEIAPNEDEVAEARWLTLEGIRGLSPVLASNEEVLEMLERWRGDGHGR